MFRRKPRTLGLFVLPVGCSVEVDEGTMFITMPEVVELMSFERCDEPWGEVRFRDGTTGVVMGRKVFPMGHH